MNQWPECTVEGCWREINAKGLCHAHYYRARHGISFETPIKTIIRNRGCDIDGCGGKHMARGLCSLHYQRSMNGNPIEGPSRRRRFLRQMCFLPNGEENYCDLRIAHDRAKFLWGNADQHPCVICASPAKDWAYDGTDASERYERVGTAFVAYSRFPEFYMPMCRGCHCKRDKGKAAVELCEYREWKHRTGLTLPELDSLIGDKQRDR